MYTRTALDKSTVLNLASNESLGHMFVETLRNRAILLLTESDIEEMRTKLPTQVWKRLEQYILTSRIPRRIIRSHTERMPAEPQTEVIIESPLSSSGQPPIRTDIPGYVDCPIVAKRKDLQEHRRPYTDREEFWTDALYPVLDSCDPNSRVVHLVDQYVFQDFRRDVRVRGSSDPRIPDRRSGLVWLMSKLNGISANQSSLLIFVIVTAELDDDDGIDAQEMSDLLNEILTNISTSALRISVKIVPADRIRPRPRCFQTRRLIVSSRSNFVLSKGAVDLTQSKHHGDDSINFSGFWSPSLNKDEADALNEVLRDKNCLQIAVK